MFTKCDIRVLSSCHSTWGDRDLPISTLDTKLYPLISLVNNPLFRYSKRGNTTISPDFPPLSQVARSPEGMHVLHIQGALHELLHRDPRVPHRTRNRLGTSDGCQLLGLLNYCRYGFIYSLKSASVLCKLVLQPWAGATYKCVNFFLPIFIIHIEKQGSNIDRNWLVRKWIGCLVAWYRGNKTLSRFNLVE